MIERYRHIAAELFNQPWMMEESRLLTFQQVFFEVLERKQAGMELSEAELAAIVAAGKKDGAPRQEGKVAVIPIYGFIHRFASQAKNISGPGGTSVDQVRQSLRQALGNPEVEQILLAIDSPGGSVYGIDELASELRAGREQKKIVAHVDPMAASAAYYLASQASEIAVTPTGEVGSIGVFATHLDLSKMQEMRGVKTTLISAGKYKTEGSPHGPLTEDAQAHLQSRVNEYYDMFVGAVAKGRGVTPKQVREGMGQGRMLGASAAKDMGMVDRVETLDQTLERMTRHGARGVMVAQTSAQDAPEKIAAQAPAIVILARGDESESILRETARVAELLARETSKPETSKPSSLSLEATVATQAMPAPGAEPQGPQVERDRAATIIRLATRYHAQAGAAEKWIADGTSIPDVMSALLEQRVATARPLPPEPAREGSHVEVLGAPGPKKTASQSFATCARAIAATKGQGLRAAAQYADETLKDRYAAAALGASTGAAGGFAVPEAMASEIIEYLRPLAVFRSLGPRLLPLVNGQLTLPGFNVGATASYGGENKDITATSATFRQAKLNAKKLTCLLPISNDLIRYTPGVGIDNAVRDDMVAAVRQAEDLAFLRGAGTAYGPKGIRNWCPSANVIDANGTVNLANITTDLGKLIVALQNANVIWPRTQWGWIWAPRTENFLATIRTANGEYAFRDEMFTRGTFWGIPFRSTTQIPVNLNLLGGSNESEVMLAAFPDMVIGDVPQMVMDTSQEASWYDGSAYQSAYSQDQTIIRMILEHDLAVRHVESIAVLQKAIWI